MTWFEAAWFFLPAGVANMAPVLASRLPLLRAWNTPLDLGITLNGKRLFGDNKTIRGIVAGVLAAVTVAALQASFFNVGVTPSIAVAALLGLGALSGDALKSFFKRQLNIRPGSSWFPFDQLDYVIGGLAFAALLQPISLLFGLQVAVIYFTLHLIVSYIGYLLGLKRTPI